MNKEKNDKDFADWLAENFADPDKLQNYKHKHYIPSVDLAFTNFEEFFEEREKLLIMKLKQEFM